MEYVANKHDDMFNNIDNSIKINKNDSIIYLYYLITEIIDNIDKINNNIDNFIYKLKYDDKYEISNLDNEYIIFLLINTKDILKDINDNIIKKYDVSKL